MGVPFSQEVRNAVDHAADLKSAAIYFTRTAVDIAADLKFVVICFTIIHAISLGFILLAVIALLITVNPDLVEERKALVTPVLKGGLRVLKRIISGRRILVGTTETPREEHWRDEGTVENERQSGHDNARVQRRRRASPM
jgi:hypothetical protein